MFLRSVVLPEPRKPVKIVTGTGERLAWSCGDGLLLYGVLVSSTSNRVGASSSSLSDMV